MKVYVIGTYHGQQMVFGQFRLDGDKIKMSIDPQMPDQNFAREIMKDVYKSPMAGLGRGLSPVKQPREWLAALAPEYSGAALRATKPVIRDEQGVEKTLVTKALWSEEDHPRADDGKFSSGGGGGGKTDPATLAERSVQGGGITYNPSTGEEPKEGFAVATHLDRAKVIDHDPTPEQIESYMQSNADVFEKDPRTHLGLWKNPATNKTHMSISTVFTNRDEALDLAQDTNQIAVYDLKSGKDIKTPPGPKIVVPEGVPEQTYRPETTAEDFIKVRDANPRAEFMSKLDPAGLAGNKLILNKDGNAGATVAPDGDIQNVFRNPGAPKGAGTAAALEAVRRGGRMLDCYEYERKGRPGLPEVYRKAGFIETGRMKFNAMYHPEWAKEGRTPDVVFMAYVGGDQSNSPKSKRYYDSTEWDRAKRDSAAHANPERESEVERQLREQSERRKTPATPRGLGHIAEQTERWRRAHPKKAVTIEAENEKIKRNKKIYEGTTHRFRAAEWTHGNGHPRCIRCGAEEPIDGLCMPDVLKYEAMLDVWSRKYAQEFEAATHGRIEPQGEPTMPTWIETYHSKCIAKSEACGLAWPACPLSKTAKQIEKYITGGGNKWTVHAESGKVLGTHGSKAEAEAQLRAIEANKHHKAVEIDPATVNALAKAFDEFISVNKIILKSKDDVMVEPIEANVFRVDYGLGKRFFRIEKNAVEGGEPIGVELAYYQQVPKLVPVQKAEKQRYTLGVVYAPGEVDYHGDTMSEVELEKSAWAFAKKEGLTSRAGLMHMADTNGAGEVVESYIYRGPVWKIKGVDGIEQTIVPGTWMLGVVWNPEAWTRVERGALKGYSLQGIARKFAKNGEEV